MRTRVNEMVLSFVTAPGAVALINAAAAQCVAAQGQGLQVRKGKGYILNPWANNNVTGGVRIRSGAMHNSTENINYEVVAGVTRPAFGDIKNRVYSQDVLDVAQYGSAVGGQIEQNIIPITYDSVEGLNANLLTANEVEAYKASGDEEGKENLAMRVNVAGVITGQWGGQVALSTLVGYGFKPNRYYAVRGMSTTVRCCAIGFRSTENAGVRVAVPGDPGDPRMTGRFFMDMSKEYNIPAVPIFSAASLADAFIDVACNQAGGNFVITVHATLLNKSFSPGGLF